MANHKFLIFFVVCIFHSTAKAHYSAKVHNEKTNVEDVEYNACETNECRSLHNYYKHLAKRLNPSVNRCEDIFEHTCNKTKSVYNTYIMTLISIEQTFSEESLRLDSTLIEKELHRQCRALGQGRDKGPYQNNYKSYEHLMKLLHQALENNRWQDLDHELHKSGYGYAFFDIKVIRDPENARKNIIMIQPPSRVDLDPISYFIENLRKYRDIQKSSVHEGHTDLYYVLHHIEMELVIKFLNSLISALLELERQNLDLIDNKKTTIYHWHHTFNENILKSETSEMKWNSMIIKQFRTVGIDITEDEPLIVRNQLYFTYLKDIFKKTPNNVIAITIVMMALANNMRYFDWNFAEKYYDNPDRIWFCLHETKLYGTTHEIYQKNKDNKNRAKLHHMLNNIIRSTKSEIYRANSLDFQQESYLLAKLNAIASKQYSIIWTDDHISNYYNGYTLTDNYFKNIRNYREMIKNKELLSLKNPTSHTSFLPFSFVDLVNPANRLKMNMYVFELEADHRLLLPKQISYATYGVKLASLLYGLLNENKKIDTLYYNVDAHPSYSTEIFECLPDELITAYNRVHVISNVYGFKIAYDAMLEDHTNNFSSNELYNKNLFSKGNLTDANQIFYLSYYDEAKCNGYDNAVNFIISRSKMFENNFKECGSIETTCKSNLFDYMVESVFLINL